MWWWVEAQLFDPMACHPSRSAAQRNEERGPHRVVRSKPMRSPIFAALVGDDKHHTVKRSLLSAVSAARPHLPAYPKP